MILLVSGDSSENALAAQLSLADQYSMLGHRVFIDEGTVPIELVAAHQYLLAPYLVDSRQLQLSKIIVLASDVVSASQLSWLRSRQFSSDCTITLLGRFASKQARLDCALSIAYSIGREPATVDVAQWQGKKLPMSADYVSAGIFRVDLLKPDQEQFLAFFLQKDTPLNDTLISEVSRLSASTTMPLILLADRKLKSQLALTSLKDIPAFAVCELPATAFAGMIGVAVIFDVASPSGWVESICQDLMLSGKILIDCSPDAGLVSTGAPALRGPSNIHAVGAYLNSTVAANFDDIKRRITRHQWLHSHSVARIDAAIGDPSPKQPVASEGSRRRGRIVFFPTNGNGLGHAQRCMLVADAISNRRQSVFAAFPSCVPLVQSRGFDCLPLIQRSEEHADINASDVVNYCRLRRNLGGGDTIVFDGGSVYESVYRLILEKQLDAVWIRRGLWQRQHVNSTTLDREFAFSRVIVPDEPFPELNDDYTFGPKVNHIGPIVQHSVLREGAIDALRTAVASKFHRDAPEIVVSMLGGHSVRINRDAQLHTICSKLERRPNCLHLIVVWPGSPISPIHFGWRNSHVVQTHHAIRYCQIADLVISAAGYNSFNDVMYHRIPTIFVPQTAPYMDDQERRARAASSRGLAETVLSSELLRLDQEITLFLDEGKSQIVKQNLAACTLPIPGNVAAAEVILGLGQ